jgi:hypothetical protein
MRNAEVYDPTIFDPRLIAEERMETLCEFRGDRKRVTAADQ